MDEDVLEFESFEDEQDYTYTKWANMTYDERLQEGARLYQRLLQMSGGAIKHNLEQYEGRDDVEILDVPERLQLPKAGEEESE